MIKFKKLSEKTADEIIAILTTFVKDESATEKIGAAKAAIVGTIDRALAHSNHEILNDS